MTSCLSAPRCARQELCGAPAEVTSKPSAVTRSVGKHTRQASAHGRPLSAECSQGGVLKDASRRSHRKPLLVVGTRLQMDNARWLARGPLTIKSFSPPCALCGAIGRLAETRPTAQASILLTSLLPDAGLRVLVLDERRCRSVAMAQPSDGESFSNPQ